MAWKACDRMSLRRELVSLMQREEADVSALCRRFGVSRTTAYKWKARAAASGLSDHAIWVDRSRRPHGSPARSDPTLEAAVLSVRARHPTWGGRKIKRRLEDQGQAAPSASTVTAILHRHGLISAAASERAAPWKRFEHACPNDLWQMDFKGHFATQDERRCHPLTILDDHSRYALGLFACVDERATTVRSHLLGVFQRYGLPRRLLCDNGPPWGCSHDQAYTKIDLWLLRLGILPLHGRPRHPQTQGKGERLHRTLSEEALSGVPFASALSVQPALDAWRAVYNFERPHEALGLATPASRYRMSDRSMPGTEPVLRFSPGDELRKVNAAGRFSFGGRGWQMGEAFAGETIGLRRTNHQDLLQIVYGPHAVGRLDLAGRVLEQLRIALPPATPPATLT
jgi:transposase InsO family protein